MTNAVHWDRGLNLKLAGSDADCTSGHRFSKSPGRRMTKLTSFTRSTNVLNIRHTLRYLAESGTQEKISNRYMLNGVSPTYSTGPIGVMELMHHEFSSLSITPTSTTRW